MRGSPANRVPLDNDEDIEGFSAAVVRRGSFCGDAAGDRVEKLHSRSQKLRTVEPRGRIRIRRGSCRDEGAVHYSGDTELLPGAKVTP